MRDSRVRSPRGSYYKPKTREQIYNAKLAELNGRLEQLTAQVESKVVVEGALENNIINALIITSGLFAGYFITAVVLSFI